MYVCICYTRLYITRTHALTRVYIYVCDTHTHIHIYTGVRQRPWGGRAGREGRDGGDRGRGRWATQPGRARGIGESGAAGVGNVQRHVHGEYDEQRD